MPGTTRWKADTAWLGGDALVSDVLIETQGDTITAVGTGYDGEFDRRLTGLVFPGLVTAHSHAFHRALRGRTHRAGGDFWAWRQPMYQLASRLTPETYYDLARAVYAEMLLSGITLVGEFHYLHHRPNGESFTDPNAMSEAVVSAAMDVGIRITLIDAAYLASDMNGTPPLQEQTRFSDGDIESWSQRVHDMASRLGANPLARLAVAAHSVRAVTTGDLEAIAGVASELSAPLHIHVSEQPVENEACLAAHGVTPIELLHRHRYLNENTTLIHATHTTDNDRRLIAESGAGVCFCPTTEADLGDGIGPGIEYQEAGVRLSLGSDSNATIDILEEAKRIEQHDRLRLGRRAIHDPASLLDAATTGGANALGWPETGRIEPGSLADFVVLDDRSLDLAGLDLDSGVASIVMSSTRSAVTDVVVSGEMLVINRVGFGLPTLSDIDQAIKRVWM